MTRLNKNKLVVISGCSSGGKSTIVAEFGKQGYTVIEEIGRKLVKEQLDIKSGITPWEKPQEFCKLLVSQSIEAYHQAAQMKAVKNNIIFFDRSFLEGVCYFQSLNIHEYDHFVNELRYYPIIFMTPPWKEIYTQDSERKHFFEDGVNEYNHCLNFYPRCGYRVIDIPKNTVTERMHFILQRVR